MSQVPELQQRGRPVGLGHQLPQSSGQCLSDPGSGFLVRLKWTELSPPIRRSVWTLNSQHPLRQFPANSLVLLQNDGPGPPVLRRHSSSDICKQKFGFGTMPLVPIRGNESNSSMLSANQTLVRPTFLCLCIGDSHRPKAFSFTSVPFL